MKLEYLNDEELDNLIRECESDLVQAPSGLLDKVLEQVDSSNAGISSITDIRTVKSRERKLKEYNRFKWQVVGTMVASLALFIAIQAFMPKINSYIGEPGIPTKEEVIANREVPTKEELLSKKKVPTKKDIIARQEFLSKIDLYNKSFKEED